MICYAAGVSWGYTQTLGTPFSSILWSFKMPKPVRDAQSFQEIVSSVLRNEASCIARLADDLPASCAEAVQVLFRCQGRVIVTGMGKMSAIARKTAATLCSVGTPAIFLHPVEALHGDLGIVSNHDVLLALSNSGETNEILELIPYLKSEKTIGHGHSRGIKR